MKNYLFTLAILSLILSCKSPEKLLQQGDYDAVIDKTMKDIMKGKADNDDKMLLDKAYTMANQRDQQQIDFLVQENRAENWEQIYFLYSALNVRQTKVQQVMPLTIGSRRINYKTVDYNTKIIEAKANAAKYYYSAGVSSMDLNTKEGYRQAFYDFQKVKEYRPGDYPDLDNLMNDARYLGISRVLIQVDRRAPGKIPPAMWTNLMNINTDHLNTFWVEYHLARLDRDTQFDYIINVAVRNIDVTAPQVSTREYVRRKRVQDGYEYVLDARGNVKKDSLGNDIKVPKYKDLSCTVIETTQNKSVTMRGEVEFVSANPSRLIKKEPVAGTSVCEHVSGKARGDRDALLPEDWKLIDVDEVPFPDDLSMIEDCSLVLSKAISDLICNNRNVIY